MIEINSAKNKVIKDLKKLDKKKHRIEQGHYIIEGEHLIEEALKSNESIKAILVTEEGKGLISKLPIGSRKMIYYLVKEDIFNTISAVPTPQGIMALVALRKSNLPLELTGQLLLLDNVQDPGNVGTMIRTADAAGYGTVILGEGCADIYNPKVLRSMQGSHFHLRIIEGDLKTIIPELKKRHIGIYGTELNEKAVHYQELKVSEQFGLLMGNEGQGVSEELLQLTDKNTYIPILGKAESLNVAVAAGVLMFSL